MWQRTEEIFPAVEVGVPIEEIRNHRHVLTGKTTIKWKQEIQEFLPSKNHFMEETAESFLESKNHMAILLVDHMTVPLVNHMLVPLVNHMLVPLVSQFRNQRLTVNSVKDQKYFS